MEMEDLVARDTNLDFDPSLAEVAGWPVNADTAAVDH